MAPAAGPLGKLGLLHQDFISVLRRSVLMTTTAVKGARGSRKDLTSAHRKGGATHYVSCSYPPRPSRILLLSRRCLLPVPKTHFHARPAISVSMRARSRIFSPRNGIEVPPDYLLLSKHLAESLRLLESPFQAEADELTRGPFTLLKNFAPNKHSASEIHSFMVGHQKRWSEIFKVASWSRLPWPSQYARLLEVMWEEEERTGNDRRFKHLPTVHRFEQKPLPQRKKF